MKYFKGSNDELYVYDDDVAQDVMDQLESDFDITLTPMTEEEYANETAPTLDALKTHRRIDIEYEFAGYSQMPVTVDGVEFYGGVQASTEYKSVYDFAEMSGQTTVGFRDTSGIKHTLSLADAKSVLMAIGADYYAKDAERDALVEAVLAATSEDELNAINISF